MQSGEEKRALDIFENGELSGVELNLVTGIEGLFYIIVYGDLIGTQRERQLIWRHTHTKLYPTGSNKLIQQYCYVKTVNDNFVSNLFHRPIESARIEKLEGENTKGLYFR